MKLHLIHGFPVKRECRFKQTNHIHTKMQRPRSITKEKRKHCHLMNTCSRRATLVPSIPLMLSKWWELMSQIFMLCACIFCVCIVNCGLWMRLLGSSLWLTLCPCACGRVAFFVIISAVFFAGLLHNIKNHQKWSNLHLWCYLNL